MTKKFRNVWSFTSARVVKKPNCIFGEVIFQKPFRASLGPLKHVLHLVWSVFGISSAINIALKVPEGLLYDNSRMHFIQETNKADRPEEDLQGTDLEEDII